MSKEIIEGNKLIAEFMGYKYYPYSPESVVKPGWWSEPVPKDRSLNKLETHKFLCRRHPELRYYNSWDWMMPVVEKIENLDFSKESYFWEDCEGDLHYNSEGTTVCIEDNSCYIYENLLLDPIHIYVSKQAGTKLKATFEAVVEFIQWYNERK